MSECDRIEEYLDDVLSAAGRSAMDRHLEACAACTKAVAEYRRLRRLALEAAPVEVPDDLGFRIRERLAAAPAPRRRPARIFAPFAFAGAAAVAAAAVLFAVLIRPVTEVPPPKGPTPEAVTMASAADLSTAVSDWLVQAGNASSRDVDRLRREAKDQRLLSRVREALPEALGTADGEYLTAVSDLLVQLDNGDGPGFLAEEARLVARGRPQ